jgi:siderophore synthetase component
MRGFRLCNSVSIRFYYFSQLSHYMFLSYDHLQVEIHTAEINTTDNRSVVLIINFRCKYFRSKMVVRQKHIAAKLNKIVKK